MKKQHPNTNNKCSICKTFNLTFGIAIVLGILFIYSGNWVFAQSPQQIKFPHTIIDFKGTNNAYANAIGQIVETAREISKNEFGFDMPETVNVSIECDATKKLQLWNDGNDRIYLVLSKPEQLHKPSETGVFQIYGFCHEIGHMAMYRTLKERFWMKGDAAEGWAHFCGSYIIDKVYEKCGESLWPDAYDYRADGMKRLNTQLASPNPDTVTICAGKWRELSDLIGKKSIPILFQTWEKAASNIDPANPNITLKLALPVPSDSSRATQLDEWFKGFAKDYIVAIKPSNVPLQTVNQNALSSKSLSLKYDDGTSDGMQSIAGSGHTIFFDVPAGKEYYLTQISIYGSRYGYPQAPREDFYISLCDGNLKPIKTWRKPYGLFERGNPQWYKIVIEPTRVSQRFAICFNFNPTATKGIYVHRDDSTSGHSAVALPGGSFNIMPKGDWMIRVEVDTTK